jgi:bZIP transcription factor
MTTTSTSLQHHVHTAPNMNNNISINSNGIKIEYGEGLAAPPSLGNHPGAAELSSGSSSPSPELVVSGVPSPFAQNSPSEFPHYGCSSSRTSPGMNSVNWASQHAQPVPSNHDVGSGGQGQLLSQPMQSAPLQGPNPFQPINHAQTNAPSSASVHSGVRLQAHSSTVSAGPGMTLSAPQPMRPFSHENGNNENANPGDVSAGTSPETTTKGGLNNRRQKRLERNRESARLSRRRRKQYLEVLEERVKNLSVEMDKGRRQHVAVSVDTLLHRKRHTLEDPSADLTNVESVSSSGELRVAATFLTQQISSLSVAPHIKFLLWLSMQNDSFFRGGRASSERLSAARIGERVSKAQVSAPSKALLYFVRLTINLSFILNRCFPAEMTKSLQPMECGRCSATK